MKKWSVVSVSVSCQCGVLESGGSFIKMGTSIDACAQLRTAN